jgi:ubiquinone/menaquinone biosynthesis C-methylase UbiE
MEEGTMERKDRIRSAYRLTGSNDFYDGMITCSTFLGKSVSRLVWDMNAEDSTEYQLRALSGIPEGFPGRLLEVPVGTGILTMPLYQTLPDADIVCLDYSPDMLGRAQDKANQLGIENVTFREGDVGELPFEDETFDIVLSMNGFHAFPDKDAAYRETFRVLKCGGTFCGCFYVTGCHSRTDLLIRHVYQPMKFFTPPYETMESLRERLESLYEQVELSNVKGIACFVCRKGCRETQQICDTQA